MEPQVSKERTKYKDIPECGDDPQICCDCCKRRQPKTWKTRPRLVMDKWTISKHGYLIGLSVLWATLTCVVGAEQPPIFTREPQSVISKLSSKVVLHCETQTSATIEWLLNDSELESSGLTDIEIQDGRLLIIPSFRRSRSGRVGHEGVYQCVASNRAGAVISREARVEAAYMGEFYEGFKDMYINVTEGNVAFIPCAPPSGRPQPITSFELNGTEIDLNNAQHRVLPSGNLQISSVHPRHNGRYRCIATNPLTNQVRRAGNVVHLTVLAAMTNQVPVFRRVPPLELKVERGDNLTLECVVEGAPVPVVTWSKYGGKLPEDRHSQNLGNLILYDVNRLDSGTYICGAQNGVGPRQVAVGQVDVLEPPIIQAPPVSQVITVGSNVTFDCQGRGQPEVTTRWFHDGQKLTDEIPGVILAGTAVTLVGVGSQHTGVYQCIAQNTVGSISAAAILNVIKSFEKSNDRKNDERPENEEEMQGIAPDLERNPVPSNGRAPKDKSVPPVATSPVTPRANINGDILEIADEPETSRQNDRGKRKNGQRNRDRGNQGTSSQSANPDIDEASLDMIPPSKPRVTKLSDTSVMLEWSLEGEGGLPITFFKVQYKELFEDTRRRRWRTIDTDIPSYVWQFEVPRLKPGSTYRFRIVGIYSNNDNMHGQNSRRFTMKTVIALGPKAPQMGPVIVEARPTESSIKLKWQYLPDEWTPVEGFHVYYKTYGSQTDYQIKTMIGSHKREAELLDLMPNTMYTIQMKGYNSVGESEFSNVVVKRTSDGDYHYPDWLPGDDPTDWPIPPRASSSTTTLASEVEQHSTESSNQMLYLILGCVLGFLVLFLLLFMGICAWKQRQRVQMMAALEGRNKFHDPARTIYAHDSIRMKHMNGNGFLLNGLNGHPDGHQNGDLPLHTYPRMNIVETPLNGPGPPHHHSNGHIPVDRRSDASMEEVFDQPPPPPPPILEEDFKDSQGRYDRNMSSFSRSPPSEQHLYSNAPCVSPRSHELSTPTPMEHNSCQDSLRSDNSRSQGTGSRKVHRDPLLTDHIPRSHERLPLYQKGDSIGRAPRAIEQDRAASVTSSPLAAAKCNHRRRKSPEEHTEEECTPLNEPHHYGNEPTAPPIDSRYLHLPVPMYHASNDSFEATDYEVIDEDEEDEPLPSYRDVVPSYRDVAQSSHGPGHLDPPEPDEYSDDDNEAVIQGPPSPSPLPRFPRAQDYPATDAEDD